MAQTCHTKVCFKCLIEQSLDDFPLHPRMKDGHLNKCKACARLDAKTYRKNKEEYYQAYDRQRAKQPKRKESNKERVSRNRDKVNENNRRSVLKLKKQKDATTVVNNALRDGRLSKLPCFICGEIEVQGHHPDYDAPLDVVWLCIKHHSQIHAKYSEEYNIEIMKSFGKSEEHISGLMETYN